MRLLLRRFFPLLLRSFFDRLFDRLRDLRRSRLGLGGDMVPMAGRKPSGLLLAEGCCSLSASEETRPRSHDPESSSESAIAPGTCQLAIYTGAAPPPSCCTGAHPCAWCKRMPAPFFFFHIVARCGCRHLPRAHREGLAALQRP